MSTKLQFLAQVRALEDKGLPTLLTVRQVCILALLAEAHPKHETVRGLSAKLGVGKPAITRAITSFAALRLAKRERNPKDGRDVFIRLDERGHDLVRTLWPEDVPAITAPVRAGR